MDRETIDRFYKHIKLPSGDGCWEFTPADTNGYGQIKIEGRNRLAHRVAWEIFYGTIPELNVLHSCDNKPCVRPDHLFQGTQKDNIQDAINKGRFILKGRQLTDREKRLVVKSVGRIRQYKLAEFFGVSRGTICRLRKSGETYD